MVRTMGKGALRHSSPPPAAASSSSDEEEGVIRVSSKDPSPSPPLARSLPRRYFTRQSSSMPAIKRNAKVSLPRQKKKAPAASSSEPKTEQKGKTAASPSTTPSATPPSAKKRKVSVTTTSRKKNVKVRVPRPTISSTDDSVPDEEATATTVPSTEPAESIPPTTPAAESTPTVAPTPSTQEQELLHVIQQRTYAADPIPGNVDIRARNFKVELTYDIAAFESFYGTKDSIGLCFRYSIDKFMNLRPFYYPRVVQNFYQSMTTLGVQNPLTMQFTLDGKIGHIDARLIAATLGISHFPPLGAGFKEWKPMSANEMVSILSKGTRTRKYLPRSDLSPALWFIDHVLRANLYPCQHKAERRDAFLEALFQIAEGFWFSPSHLIMAALFYFEQRVHVKKLKRAEIYELYFPRLLSQVIEAAGLISDVEHERKIECREVFDMRKWHFCTLSKEDMPIPSRSDTTSPFVGSPSVRPNASTPDIGSSAPAPTSGPAASATPTGPAYPPVSATIPAPIHASGTIPAVPNATPSAVPSSSSSHDTMHWLCSTMASLQAQQSQQTQHLVTLTSLLVRHLTGIEVPAPPPPPYVPAPPPAASHSPVHPMPHFDEPSSAAAAARADPAAAVADPTTSQAPADAP